jgi:hypothetical protein
MKNFSVRPSRKRASTVPYVAKPNAVGPPGRHSRAETPANSASVRVGAKLVPSGATSADAARRRVPHALPRT